MNGICHQSAMAYDYSETLLVPVASACTFTFTYLHRFARK